VKSYDHLNSREHPLYNFELLDILCALIGQPSEKLIPFEFLESFRCAISSDSIYYAHELDFWAKSYDHLNFSRLSVAEFRASRYMMRLNRTSEWKVITIWISRELLLFNFERLDILCPRIGRPCEKLWRLEFSRASVVQFWASHYVMRLNRTSEWKVMTVWISWELLLINFERLDILCTGIRLLGEMLWPF